MSEESAKAEAANAAQGSRPGAPADASPGASARDPQGASPGGGAPAAKAKGRPLRADAKRNRDRILTVAGAHFAANGPETSLEAIAKEAGVGIGTLYRRFPNREALLEAVYRREVDELCAAAEALGAHLPPFQALEEWLRRMVDYMAAKRGLAPSLKLLLAGDGTLFQEVGGRIRQALGARLRAAVEAGEARDDVDVNDVMQALSGLYSAPEGPDWRDRALRLVSIVAAGLRRQG